MGLMAKSSYTYFEPDRVAKFFGTPGVAEGSDG